MYTYGMYFDEFSDEFFGEFSDEFFWRIFWRIFWQIFWQVFWLFGRFSVTYNLLTIASFRIGVPSNLFFANVLCPKCSWDILLTHWQQTDLCFFWDAYCLSTLQWISLCVLWCNRAYAYVLYIVRFSTLYHIWPMGPKPFWIRIVIL